MSVELQDSYQAIYERAMTDIALGNPDQGRAALQRIVSRLVRLRPETIQRKEDLQLVLFRAWESLDEFLQQEERFDEAIALSEQVADHLPGDHIAELHIVSLRINRGDVEEGLADLRAIAERDQSFAAWYALGAEYARLERHEEAIASLRTALARATNNRAAATANLGLFRVYKALGQTSEALSAWNMAAVLNPDQAAQVEIVYRWLIESGELDQAAKYLRRETNPMRRTFYQGYLDQQAGRERAARTQWQQVLDMDAHADEENIDLWLEAALRLNEPQRALDQVESLREHDHPFDASAQLMVAIAHAMLGQLDEARTWFDVYAGQLSRPTRPEDVLDAEDRALFESLVTDPETRQALAAYWQG